MKKKIIKPLETRRPNPLAKLLLPKKNGKKNLERNNLAPKKENGGHFLAGGR